MSKKTEYWLELCDDDLITAKALLGAKRLLHSSFFCHMVVEKALKAVVTHKTDEIPPKIHDLPKLATLGGIWGKISAGQKEMMKKLAPFQIEARYPEHKERVASALTAEYCSELLEETEDFLCWIKKQLEK